MHVIILLLGCHEKLVIVPSIEEKDHRRVPELKNWVYCVYCVQLNWQIELISVILKFAGNNPAPNSVPPAHHSKSKKHHQQAATEPSQQCLVCSAPVKTLNKYFCDKCDQRFTAPASTNYLSNVQGRSFNSPAAASAQPATPSTRGPPTQHPQTYRCLQCPFVTEDSSAMIGHHLHAHSSYPMPM